MAITKPNNLSKYRELFRDEASYQFFAKDIQETFKNDLAPVFIEEHFLGGALSPEATKGLLCERMMKRVLERPALLEEITRRLEEEDIVD